MAGHHPTCEGGAVDSAALVQAPIARVRIVSPFGAKQFRQDLVDVLGRLAAHQASFTWPSVPQRWIRARLVRVRALHRACLVPALDPTDAGGATRLTRTGHPCLSGSRKTSIPTPTPPRCRTVRMTATVAREHINSQACLYVVLGWTADEVDVRPATTRPHPTKAPQTRHARTCLGRGP
jgi:hypothetical protein